MDEPIEIARGARRDILLLEGVDRVVAVPSRIAEKAVALALEKIEAEDTTRAELLCGETLKAVFARHGVL
jgi:hypothetical protein